MTDPSLSPHELVALAGRLAAEGGRMRHRADYDRDFAVTGKIAVEAVNRARQALDALWRLYADGDPNTVLLLRLTLGGTRIARSRA